MSSTPDADPPEDIRDLLLFGVFVIHKIFEGTGLLDFFGLEMEFIIRYIYCLFTWPIALVGVAAFAASP